MLLSYREENLESLVAQIFLRKMPLIIVQEKE